MVISATPRDFTSDRPVDPKSKERDFRYQGFPGGNFFSPRQRPILPEDGIVSPGLQENHALKRYFDTSMFRLITKNASEFL